ncbi:unnamed protein product [Urochloa humidicola]
MDNYNYNILVWNARGLNARCRRDDLREVVSSNNASLVCVQETKLAVISPFLVNEMLGTRFTSFAYVPSIGASGGVLTTCRGPEVVCSNVHTGSFSVTTRIKVEHELSDWCLTNVYGPQPDVDKVAFLCRIKEAD